MVAVQQSVGCMQLRKQRLLKMMQHSGFAESGGVDDAVEGPVADDADEAAAPTQLNPTLAMGEWTQPGGELVLSVRATLRIWS